MEILEINIAAKPTNKWAEYIPMSILNLCEKVDMVGSHYTCNPPPDTDIDIILLPKKWHDVVIAFVNDDSWDMSEVYEAMPDGFESFRKGKVNALVMNKAEMFDKFIIARDVCKALNLMDKKDRIKVHDIIMNKDNPVKDNQW